MDNLLLGIKNSDEPAFEQVYKLKKEKVLAFFYKKTRSIEDAADLMQSVFFRLWKYRHTIEVYANVDQHLFQLAKHVYIDFQRTNKHRVSEPIDTMEFPNPSSDYDTLERESVLYHLKSESDLNQRIFLLNKLHGYSYQQIAHLLSMPVKSIDNYINKTLKRLRKKLK